MPFAQSSELPPPSPMIESIVMRRSSSRFNHARIGIDFEVMKPTTSTPALQRSNCFVDVTRRDQTMDRRRATCAESSVRAQARRDGR